MLNIELETMTTDKEEMNQIATDEFDRIIRSGTFKQLEDLVDLASELHLTIFNTDDELVIKEGELVVEIDKIEFNTYEYISREYNPFYKELMIN